MRSFFTPIFCRKVLLDSFKGGENMDNFKHELKKITYEPAQQLVRELEKNYDKLDTAQKMDLEKLKFGLKMFDLEEQLKNENKPSGGYRWA
jgi:hypothetical protein